MRELNQEDIQRMLADLGATQPSAPPLNRGSMPLSKLGQQQLEQQIKEVEQALQFITADCLRGNGTILDGDRACSEGWWAGVLWAVYRHLGEDGKELARQWSKTCPERYTEEGFEKTWKEGRSDHANPVTIASVFKLARLKGWKAPTHLSPQQVYGGQTAFRLLDREAIMAQPQLRWRVKGIYPESGIAAIYGASGCGKSFLAKDLAICIAKGARWFGHRVSASPVTYIMLEAEAGLRNRVQAWEDHNKQQIPPNFLAMAQPFELADDEQVEQLGAVLPQGGVTIIDTLNRAAPGLDENSSQDMGRILAGMKRLQAITNGLVIIVHHTGKDASKGLRGHSSLHAALDGAIEVERTAASRFWSAAKVKDGEDGKHVAFKLHVIDLGVDADGDPINSCAVGPDTGAIFEHKEPSGKRQLPAYRAIVRELGAATNTGMGGASAQTPCVSMDRAIEVVVATYTAEQPNKRRNRAKGVVQDLLSGGYLHSGLDEGGEAWLWQ